MKIFFRRIHLYLAFAAGLVIMTTCFTGAVLVFEEELQHLTHKERYFVAAGTAAQPVENMIASLQREVPGAIINGVKTYTDSSRTTELYYAVKKDAHKKAAQSAVATNSGKPKPGAKNNSRLVAYLNPYNAEVIERYNHQESFFFSMMSLHRWLLGGDIGKLIVGISTLLFLFILITGIILWWPKTKNILRQRLQIKWESGWKRINHDIHIVLGFYSAIFLFIFAFTGLAWSFTWFNKGIFKVTRSSMEQPKPPVCIYRADSGMLSWNEVSDFMKKEVKDVIYYNISSPKDSTSAWSVNVLPNDAPHESASDLYFIDRYQPSILRSQKFSERNLGQRVRSTFKPIHVSSIFGTTSKIIGLIVCIFGVFFPATGYIMWWLRTRKKSRKIEMN